MEARQCLCCKAVFPSVGVLRGHLKQKSHFRFHAGDRHFDCFFLDTYREFQQNAPTHAGDADMEESDSATAAGANSDGVAVATADDVSADADADAEFERELLEGLGDLEEPDLPAEELEVLRQVPTLETLV